MSQMDREIGVGVSALQPNPYPGKLIALEGLDGAGTTSQAARLAEWLRRYRRDQVPQVMVTQEPSQGPAGALIRSVLSRRIEMDPRTLAALFVADRLDHLYSDQGIVARLQAGTWVIVDRYYLSSFAYQPLSLRTEQEIEWFRHLHTPCPVPDMTLFLDVSVSVCLERIALNRGFHFELFEKVETLRRVYDQYLQAIQQFRQEGHNIQMVQGEKEPGQVAKAIRERLKEAFFKSGCLSRAEQQSLWQQWPVLRTVWQEAARQLGLGLVGVRRIAPDPFKNPAGGFQLALAGPTNIYYVTGYLNMSRTALKLFARGKKEDETRRRLETLCRTLPASPGQLPLPSEPEDTNSPH